MEFDPKAFFVEKEAHDVEAFVVIESSESGPGYGEPSYRMAEKWTPHDSDPEWTTYWIPEETLLARIERGECAYAKDVSDKQFKGVLNLAGVTKQVTDESKAVA